MSTLPTVALVGRPNVGKSRLFNRLARRRLAIVHDQAGVTRDVNSTVVRSHYTLLDTGGIGLVVDMDHEKLIAAAEEQNPDYDWEDIQSILEEHDFETVDFVLGPSLD